MSAPIPTRSLVCACFAIGLISVYLLLRFTGNEPSPLTTAGLHGIATVLLFFAVYSWYRAKA